MKEINARGLACPAPVLQTKNILEEEHPDQLCVTVDNEAAQQNVQRFLESKGLQTLLKQQGDDYLVYGTSTSSPIIQKKQTKTVSPVSSGAQKILIMCATDRMGDGDDELGKKLMHSFLATLNEMDELWQLVFVNNGVKLTIDTSEILNSLKKLEKNGVNILVCGTCLTHFNLLDKKQVGVTTNMLDIISGMQLADKVINL